MSGRRKTIACQIGSGNAVVFTVGTNGGQFAVHTAFLFQVFNHIIQTDDAGYRHIEVALDLLDRQPVVGVDHLSGEDEERAALLGAEVVEEHGGGVAGGAHPG